MSLTPGRSSRADGHPTGGNATYVALVVAVSLLAAAVLLAGPGLVNTRAGGDSPFLVQRVYELSTNLRSGVFPARWMPSGAHGLGYPFFNFYASFPYYLASLLNLLGAGVLWGIKITQALGFVWAGLACYGLARRLGASGPGALLAATVYTMAPFHLVNVYVRGDALSEFYAFALYPTILWAATAVAQRPSGLRMAGLAASYGVLVLTHNISALVFSPLVGLWILIAALLRPEGRTWRGFGAACASIALGLLLSAWFWIPALRESRLVQLHDQTTGYFDYTGHFLADDLVQTNILHDYTVSAEKNPFNMGLAQAAIALAGIGAAVARALRARHVRGIDVLLVAALAVYTWLMTPWSHWVWEHLPLLAYAQFPWRLLSVQALLIALLAGHIPDLFRQRASLWLSAALALFVSIAGLGGLQVDRLPLTEEDITPERLMLYETYSGNIGSTIRHEYLPAEMVPRPRTSAIQLSDADSAPPLCLRGTLGESTLLNREPEHIVWEIEVLSPALAAFQTTYYPGWTAIVDDQEQAIQPLNGLGLVGLWLEPGDHQVQLIYRGTRTQRYAGWASLGGVIILLGLTIAPAVGRQRYRRALLAVTAIIALGAIWATLRPAHVETPADAPPGPLVMDFARAPYLHSEPEGIHYGESVLAAYRYDSADVPPGEQMDVVLTWEQTASGDTVQIALRSATAHLYEPAPVWATVSAPLGQDAATIQKLTLDLPAELPPGLYVPYLSVLRDGQEISPSTATGAQMSTLALEPVRIAPGARQTDPVPDPLGCYGPENLPPAICLESVSSRRLDAEHLEVHLTWHSQTQAPVNYEISLRLIGEDGQRIASRDLSPLLGGYPTSLWKPGETVTDRVVLPIPADTVIDASDSLEIVLYDRVDLKGAGSAKVSLGLANE